MPTNETIDQARVTEAMEAAAKVGQAKLDEWRVPDGKGSFRYPNRGGAIWDYEKHVLDALAPYAPEDKPTRRAFYVLVQKAASPLSSYVKREPEWNGYTVVYNVLSSVIAWLTPGFAEARAFHDVYGS